MASYEADFAAKWGGKARDIIADNQDLLSVRFKSKAPAMHHWETTEDGAMMCAGVGGPVTGKGANILIIDDPVKNPLSIKTPVTLASGSVKLLGDLVVGDSVVTMRGRGRSVLSVFDKGTCDCVKVTALSGRSVVAELTHPFLTMLGWERAVDLRIGQDLCSLSSIVGEYVYDRIVGIEQCSEECRCIEVEEDSSFLANGLVVHNSEEANSRVIREKTWDWWTSTARTRLEPFMGREGKKVQPAVIVMATRWNADDLIGRLIDPQFTSEKGEREQWEVFVFPACAEPDVERYYHQFDVKVNNVSIGAMSGQAQWSRTKSLREQFEEGNDPSWRDILGRKLGEPLCPDRFNERDLALFRGTSLRDWYALYQQRPGEEADDGNVYHRFDEHLHCKPLQRDERMQLFVSLDFNVNPMCAVVGQYDKGNGVRYMERCEVLEEIILPNSNTNEMMDRLMLELFKYQWGYTLEVEVYGDAAGSQRSPNSSKTNWQIVSEHLSLNTYIHYRCLRRKANPLIADRVNAVNTMLRSADGMVRTYVDDQKCPELLKDFKKVRWLTDSAGNSTGQLDKTDSKRTHISDALGYCVEYNFGLRARGGGRKGVAQ